MSFRTLFNTSATLYRPTVSRSRAGGITRAYTRHSGSGNEFLRFPCRISNATPSERMVGDIEFAEATGTIYLPPTMDIRRGDQIRGGVGDKNATTEAVGLFSPQDQNATEVVAAFMNDTDDSTTAFNVKPNSVVWTDTGSGRTLYDVPTYYPSVDTWQGTIVEDITEPATDTLLPNTKVGSFVNTPFVGSWQNTAEGIELTADHEPSVIIYDPTRSYATPPGITFSDPVGGTVTCDFGSIKSKTSSSVTYDCTGDVHPAGTNEVVVSSSVKTYNITFGTVPSSNGNATVSYPASRGTIGYSLGLASWDWDTAPTGDVTTDLTYPSRTYEVLGVRNPSSRRSHIEAIVKSESLAELTA